MARKATTPVKAKKPTWTRTKEILFLEHLAISSNVAASERVADMPVGSAYRHAIPREIDAAIGATLASISPIRAIANVVTVGSSGYRKLVAVGVRADTAAFASDAATMQSALQGSLGSGADKAGTLIENSLARAIRSGKLGFDDLEKSALAVLSQIAASVVQSGVSALLDGSGASSGLVSATGGLLNALFGLPGRATGGPVSPGRAYMVGEQGPEVFVPTSAGSIAPSSSGSGGRDVRVSITLNAPAGAEPQALARSSRQVARAVTQALAQAER